MSKRKLRIWVGALIAAVMIGILARAADLAAVGAIVRQALPAPLLLALLCSTGTLFCKAIRWHMLYPVGQRPPLGLSFAAVAAGQVVNWAFPARAGEAVRVAAAGRALAFQRIPAERSIALSLGVLAVEKALDVALLCVTVGMLAALVGGLPTWVRDLVHVALLALLIALVGVGLTLRAHVPDRPAAHRLEARLRRRSPRAARLLAIAVEAFGDGLSAWLSSPSRGRVVVWSLLSWCLGAASNYLVLLSLRLPANPGAAFAVLAALSGAAAVPSLPGRIGVFQYTCTVALAPFGIGSNSALAFSLALYAVVYVPPLLVSIATLPLFLSRRRLDGAAQRCGDPLAAPVGSASGAGSNEC